MRPSACVVRTIDGVFDLLPLAAADPARYACLFESAASGGKQARYDVLLAFPREVLRSTGPSDDFLGALDAAWKSERIARDPSATLPFRGGWAVFLGYETAAQIERRLQLPDVVDSSVPVALALRCPAAIIVDRRERTTHLVAEAPACDRLDAMQSDLQNAAPFAAEALPAVAIEEDPPQRFLDGVARIHEYLRAGDAFQVNLSREWRARFDQAPRPAALYASLRRANPAPFAALLQWQGWAIASSSPERLVEARGDVVQTRPIAGTRPRLTVDDESGRIRELIGHPKERAEHVMLIDLERNDLGRVCVPGSVRVDELMTVESYAHVHHIVSNVRGNLRAGVTPGQILRAVFPGGTITGCPKVRTMQIIGELEGVGRGAYTGALGYLNRDGDLDFNILIRTLTHEGERVRLRAGAGIVVDSLAERELDETRAKARGLLRALGAAG
ncbi:MAG TPA: aminodeoxychorismate synthase component I [Rudaea sp.]